MIETVHEPDGARRVLVLYWFPTNQQMRPSVRQHLHALDGQGAQIVYHNSFNESPAWLRGLEFDGVILHTTFLCERWSDRFERHRRRYDWIAKLPCTKIAIPQDEYDHSDVLDQWLAELGVETVFTCFGEEVRGVLYPTMSKDARFVEVLTGYVDEAMAELSRKTACAHDERPLDVVYRAAHLPYWFGSHGQLKHRIAEVVAERAPSHGLAIDVSTRWEDTIFGDAWTKFLMSGRAVIGVESGSSVLDRRGQIQACIRSLLDRRPELSFDEVDLLMPAGWDAWGFFAISPRHLEAVVTRTCQVLVEGTYSGVLIPHRHYIPLRRDLADIDEVLQKINDRELLHETAECAYREIYVQGAYGYADFAAEIQKAFLEGRGSPRAGRRAAFPVVRGLSTCMRGVAVPAWEAAGETIVADRLRPVAQRLRKHFVAIANRAA